jgi:hypothetical protein
MAFSIGQRVFSHFCGEGTVTSEIILDEPGRPKKQFVKFDHPSIGEREYEIGKLDRVGEECDGA